MPEQKMTYKERVAFEAMHCAKDRHPNKPMMGFTYEQLAPHYEPCAKRAIAAQAEAIREALLWQYKQVTPEEIKIPNSIHQYIDDYLLEHGYIEPKTEEDGK